MRSRETELAIGDARRVLVIGYGNPLRGDDGIGRVIAEHIAETLRPEAIDVVVAHQLTPELTEPISRSGLVIFVDAAVHLPTELTPAGRIVIPEAASLPSPVAALLGTATPLQMLTERIARARGVNPDAIHRDVDRYREAADAAEN